ncbi:hypothetical protein FRC17_007770 [Serendipita sp. 399]|nr:hypothetical protein FRC17_007770 [Serendipita sp. 399]
MSTTSVGPTATVHGSISASLNTGSTSPTESVHIIPASSTPTDFWSRPQVIIALVVASVLVLVICLLCTLLLCRYRHRQRAMHRQPPLENEIQGPQPDEMRERGIPPARDRRFDIENPAPVHLGKANGIPLFPHLKTLQLLTRTTSIVSSASTLVSRSSDSHSKDKPEIEIERAYTLQPPLPEHNSNYLSDRDPSKRRSRNTEAYETIMYSQRSPQWDSSVAKRLSNTSTIRFTRFSRGWNARSSVISTDRMTVFDENHHDGPTSPPSAQSPRSAKSPSILRKASQAAFGRRRGSTPYKKLSPSESPQPEATKFPPMEEVPEEVAYQSTTPLAPPPARMKARSPTPNNQDRSLSAQRAIATSSRSSDNGPSGPSVETTTSSSNPQPGMSILASAIAKGKVTRQEAEWVLGMPLKGAN